LIGSETGFVETHCGKYPVVYLNLKDCKGDIWEDTYQAIWLCIRDMMERHENDLIYEMQQLQSYRLDYFNPFVPKNSTVVGNSMK
jgi:hypothetical protein